MKPAAVGRRGGEASSPSAGSAPVGVRTPSPRGKGASREGVGGGGGCGCGGQGGGGPRRQGRSRGRGSGPSKRAITCSTQVAEGAEAPAEPSPVSTKPAHPVRQVGRSAAPAAGARGAKVETPAVGAVSVRSLEVDTGAVGSSRAPTGVRDARAASPVVPRSTPPTIEEHDAQKVAFATRKAVQVAVAAQVADLGARHREAASRWERLTAEDRVDHDRARQEARKVASSVQTQRESVEEMWVELHEAQQVRAAIEAKIADARSALGIMEARYRARTDDKSAVRGAREKDIKLAKIEADALAEELSAASEQQRRMRGAHTERLAAEESAARAKGASVLPAPPCRTGDEVRDGLERRERRRLADAALLEEAGAIPDGPGDTSSALEVSAPPVSGSAAAPAREETGDSVSLAREVATVMAQGSGFTFDQAMKLALATKKRKDCPPSSGSEDVTGGLRRILAASTAVVGADSAMAVVADDTARARSGLFTSIPVGAETRTGMAAGLAAAREAPEDVEAVVADVAER
ncbi:hypothetical protein Esi_0018_0082 [Ectocarpus siliculosus]|uniref:Uncharacterized protein n=1 Tax=Ectocarpus siliculosus TaxID=2880 RepID=D7FNJ5_ECTSI|nr:hypothetical protein Esi_0018_0082 [Ectocarpus siliculosus]|eukprot:CBJ26006.1 hypothetical protein Esi_0018_0082 [Ectocarpus siliculosus]